MIYERIPEEVDAIQFTGMNATELVTLTNCTSLSVKFFNKKWSCSLNVNNQSLVVVENDYVVKQEDGSVYIEKPDAFEKKFRLKEVN